MWVPARTDYRTAQNTADKYQNRARQTWLSENLGGRAKEIYFCCFESREVECKKLWPHEASSIPSLARIRSHLKLREEMWIEPDSFGYRMWMSEDVENGGLISASLRSLFVIDKTTVICVFRWPRA